MVHSIDARTSIKALLAIANAWTANQTFNDNVLFRLGTDGDSVFKHTSAVVAADAEPDANVYVGTSDHQGTAANSLVLSNITASGDIQVLVNNGGNSLEALLIDASASDIQIGHGLATVNLKTASGAITLSPGNFAVTMSQAASTTNEVLTVANTSNAAAASHAIVDIQVGGTTSTGDPQLRLTVPGGGTSWYMGVDNSDAADRLFIGVGTTVGNSPIAAFNAATSGTAIYQVQFPAANFTITDGAANIGRNFAVRARTLTHSGTTTVTALESHAAIEALTIAQSGGAMTVNKAAGLESVSATAGASVTLTHSSAFRALTGGAAVNVSGLFLEAQTAGTTGNYQILMANGGTEPPALANHVGIYTVDETAEAVLGLATENAVAVDVDETKFSHKLRLRINGATYYMMLTAT